MTSPRTLSMLDTLHSWAGIVTGLLLFVVCFSGSVLVFKDDIDRWGNPSLQALPQVAKPVGVDTVLADLARQHPKAEPSVVTVPGPWSPAYQVHARLEDGQRVKLAARADTGEIVGPVDSQLGQFVRMLHVFLFFGPRWIVGFLGVAMLVLIATGFVIHRKVLAELFTLRWGRSFRLVNADLHKAAGIWGLLFHVLIAFTGAWLGLAPVVERAYAQLSGQPLPGPPQVRVPGQAKGSKPGPEPLVSIDALIARAPAELPGLQVRHVTLRQPGRSDATVALTGPLEGHLAHNARIVFAGASGDRLELRDPRASLGSLVNNLMEPLHFGDFGGPVLKALYFLLGLSPALLSLSGTLIWIDRRKHAARTAAQAIGAPVPTAGRATGFERAMAGVFPGSVAALAVVAAASLVLGPRFQLLQADQGSGPWVYLGLAGLITLGVARLTTPVPAWRLGLALVAAAMLGAALAGGLRLGASPLGLTMAAALIAVAVFCAFVATRLGEDRVKRVRAPAARSDAAAARAAPPPGPARLAVQQALRWLAWVATMVEPFRLAHLDGGKAVVGVGHVGMLLGFFLMLPAVSLRAWYPRTATALWLAGAAGLGALAWPAGQWPLGLVALAAVAAWPAWRRPSRPRGAAGLARQDLAS